MPVRDHLYVIIDIFSRYVPGWLLAHRENAELAERLLGESVRKHHMQAQQPTIHADRGTPMASKSMALLLADLGVIKSHSRPHCSNDHPYTPNASSANFRFRHPCQPPAWINRPTEVTPTQ